MTENQSSGDNPQTRTAKLLEGLKPWEIERGKAAFMNHMYEMYDRANVEKPMNGTYTGLWAQFQEDYPLLYRAIFIRKTIKGEE